jgi:small subunit ribosomal protein S6
MSEKVNFSNYETTFIVAPDISELDVQKLVTRLQNQIVQHDGQIFATDNWGKQRLAYPIGKAEYGYYASLTFSYPTDAIKDWSNDLRLAPEVIRYLTLSLDKEGVKPSELKKVDPFKEQIPASVVADRPVVKTAYAPHAAKSTAPASEPLSGKDEATRMKELEEKLGKLLEEE